MSEPQVVYRGVGFWSLLTIVLLVLKLGVGDTAVQDCSWFLVFLPLFTPLLIVIIPLIVIAVGGAMVFVVVWLFLAIENVFTNVIFVRKRK